MPALRKLLADEDLHFDVRSAATLALAKAGDQTVTPDLIRLAKNEDGKAHVIVEESAALALGLLGTPSEEVIDALVGIAGDKGHKGSRARPFAAVSLGLLGRLDSPARSQIREALVDLLAGDETETDVVPLALLALGNLDDDSAVVPLLAALETGRVRKDAAELPKSSRSFVVDALGRLGRPGTAEDPDAVISAVRALVGKAKRGSDASLNMRRSAALALAGLAKGAERDERARTIAALQSAAEKRGDDSMRAFAVVSLGRLVGEADLGPKLRARVRTTLREQLEDGQKAFIMRPFAALGLGLAARGDRDAGRAVADEELRMPLRDAWTDAEGSAPKMRGAFAVSLGLAQDPLAPPDLLASLDVGSERLRGQIALALGMIGDDAAREPVLDLLQNDSSREVRLRAAMSVGLMGEARAVPLLVDVLRTREESQYVLGSTALALGRIGDSRALTPLLEIANGEKFPDLTRALAVVALGQIGDREQVPALAEFLRDMNYRALGASPALTELVTIL